MLVNLKMTMKLIILPLRTLASRKTFLYSSAIKASHPDIKPSVQDRIVKKATDTWLSWETAKSGWKKKVVDLGNKAISTIDYREHSLKSIPSEKAYARAFPDGAATQVIQVSHPVALPKEFVTSEIKALAQEGIPRHRQKLIYSFIIMPFTAPFMLVPVVPNLPFFYVAYRAWSHYRAMQGASHLNLLLEQERLTLSPVSTLDNIYTKGGQMDMATLQTVLRERNPEMILEVERASQQLDRADQKQQATQQASEQEAAPQVSKAEAETNKRRARTGLHK